MSKVKEFVKCISPLNNRTEMPLILYIIKVIIIFFFVKFGAELIGEGVVIALHFACGKNPLRGEMFDAGTITLIMYWGYCLMIGIMILYWKLFQKKSVAELGFTKKAGSYFTGAAMGTVLVVVSVLAVVLTGAISYKGVFANINYGFIVLMLGGFICQGAMEEVLCRGIALQLLRKRASVPLAVGISTLLFLYPHLSKMAAADALITVFAIVNLILISMIFSLLTIRFKSIWAACGLHTIWNFILYNVMGLNLSGNDATGAAIFDLRSVGSNVVNGGIYGIEASVVTAAVLAVTVFVMLVLMKGKGRETNGIQ